MKQIQVVCIGAGNRGIGYSEYALENPNEMKLIAVVDPNKIHRDVFAENHNIPENMRFAYIEDFLKANVKCDLIINATIDNLHYETTKPLLEAGYNVLMEKPVTANPNELLDLKDVAIKKGVNLFVCHVLRYTPFYKSIKQRILNGEIGKIKSMYLSEHVGVIHFCESYVVGKWRSEAECGSGFLLAKSCHDLDLMCWFNNETVPAKVVSFADRKTFIPENAPENHSDRCCDCVCEPTCKYSLLRQFKSKNAILERVRLDVDKPENEVTLDDIINQVNNSEYGRCAYEQKDLVDRQNIIIKFDNGSVGTFDLIGSCAKGERYLHIVGEDGEIFGTHGTNTYTVRKFNYMKMDYTDEIFDVSKNITSGHGGGDFGLVGSIIAYLNGDRSSISITSIQDSVNGHLCVYGAEKSRKEDVIIDMKKEYGI